MERLAGSLGALVAVVAFMGAIGYLNIAAWGAFSEQRRLDEEGVRAVAEVVDTRATDAPRSDGQWVTVCFDVSGRPVTVELAVDEPTLERAVRSGTLDVVYDASDPTAVSVAGDGRAGMLAVIAAVTDAALVAGVVTLVANDRRRRRREDASG